MRLLNTTTLMFVEDTRQIHKYAILSHTWQDEEVTYQEMLHRDSKVEGKAGFDKIKQFCRIAKSQSFDYCWIDTCCIDKLNPTELSEAINSMFQWYKTADRCIVYLSDVHQNINPEWNEAFCKSQWFTRGWTLQELLAPQQSLLFYTSTWDLLCDSSSCVDVLSRITGILGDVLSRTRVVSTCQLHVYDYSNLNNYSIATKMSWAARRETSRAEDKAYCLLGIFDVNMPLLYGEGENKAFIRLQREIIKLCDDHSIFSWSAEADKLPSNWHSIYAPSPNFFKPTSSLQPRLQEWSHSLFNRKPYTDTNFGVHITLPLVYVDPKLKKWTNDNIRCTLAYAVLDCQVDGKSICIPIVNTSGNPTLFYRHSGPNVTFDELDSSVHDVREIYIMSRSPTAHGGVFMMSNMALHDPCFEKFHYQQKPPVLSKGESCRIHEQRLRYRSQYKQARWRNILVNEALIQYPYLFFAITISFLPDCSWFLNNSAITPLLRTIVLCNLAMHPQLLQAVMSSLLPLNVASLFLSSGPPQPRSMDTLLPPSGPKWRHALRLTHEYLKSKLGKFSVRDIGHLYGILYYKSVDRLQRHVIRLGPGKLLCAGMCLRQIMMTPAFTIASTLWALLSVGLILVPDIIERPTMWKPSHLVPEGLGPDRTDPFHVYWFKEMNRGIQILPYLIVVMACYDAAPEIIQAFKVDDGPTDVPYSQRYCENLASQLAAQTLIPPRIADWVLTACSL